MTLRYRILGPTRAHHPDGGEAHLKGPRLRALLTALAAEAASGAAEPRFVPAGALAAHVWTEHDTPPADEPAALQALVGRLRRALGKDAVTSAPGGYRLAAGREDVDLFRFERLAGEGAAALDGGDARTAARLLDEALSLWRGPALADLPGRDGDPLVVRMERRRAGTRRDRLAAEVALGRPGAALAGLDGLAGLDALAAAEPLDEPLQALRIRALRAAGRRAEALRAYEEVRTRLAEALGTDPGEELRSLHAQLLQREPDRTPDALPVPPPRTPPRATNLRDRLTSFIGRDPELALLAEDLTTRRLVTLLGPGGVGKTRLAVEAAEAATTRPAAAPAPAAVPFPDGVWVAELAPVRGPSDAAEAVLTALGGREALRWGATDGTPRAPLEQLVEHCAPRRLLLVLDNCEHLLDAAATLAETVLTRCPGVTVLATSREPLGVPGEFTRTLEPLPDPLALRLLADRGGSARPGFTPCQDPEACAEICRRLDGLPLAIELAAARLRALTPRQIADRLDDRFRLLAGGSRTALPRQQTLRAVVDWSWELLDEDERAVLRRLSVFSGGCGPEELRQVCADPAPDGAAPLDGAAVLDVLVRLVDKSLVTAVPSAETGMRYGLLETIAEYAAEHLERAGERRATAGRHLVAYREFARTADLLLRGPGQGFWLRRFEAEHDNLRAAFRSAAELGEEQEALCLALSAGWFWQLLGHQSDARAGTETAASLGPDPFAPPLRRATPLVPRCTDTAPPWPEEVLWEARRGVRMQLLASQGGEGATALTDPGTRARLEAIVEAYRPGMPQNTRQPGIMWYFALLMTGEHASLAQTLDRAARDCRAHHRGWDLAFTLFLRGRLLGGGPGDVDEALALFEEAGDPWGVAEAYAARGEANEAAGHYRRAARDFRRAMETAEGIGAHSQVPVFKARLASVRLATAGTDEERAAAERLLAEAAREASHYNVEAVSTARLLLAQHYGMTSRTDRAREQLHATERDFARETPGLFTGLVAGMHAWLDCLEEDWTGAARRLGTALVQLESLAYLVAPYLIVGQLPLAAWTAARTGGPARGAALLGAHDAETARPGGWGFRPNVPGYEAGIRARAEREVRGSLTEREYASAYEEGRRLSLRDAAALARAEPDPGADG
ncbi:BTAD domain-containing putative transcriptional regulator [Streptomyces sp. NPDC001941]|uniref:ATP-binding protein n=1 Tax=Streptomyces sp. NPDC001941 TaxID=3154659 RepID=UPI00331A16E3